MVKKVIEGALAKAAEDVARHSVNIGCWYIFHQTKIPEKVILKYKKV